MPADVIFLVQLVAALLNLHLPQNPQYSHGCPMVHRVSNPRFPPCPRGTVHTAPYAARTIALSLSHRVGHASFSDFLAHIQDITLTLVLYYLLSVLILNSRALPLGTASFDRVGLLAFSRFLSGSTYRSPGFVTLRHIDLIRILRFFPLFSAASIYLFNCWLLFSMTAFRYCDDDTPSDGPSSDMGAIG